MSKKLYYKIGEACKSLDIQPYVLRYWETEFAALRPNKSKSGQRVYSEQDLAVIRRIKELLYDEGYTIAGAKKKLEGEDLGALRAVEPEPKPEKKPKVTEKKPAKKQAAPVAAEPTTEEESDEGADEPASSLPKEVRAGLEKALAETRRILVLLDKKAGKS